MAEVWRERGEKVLWLVLILALPFTSLPLVQRLTGSSMVAPAAGLILPVMVLAILLPGIVRGQRLARQSIPLLAFGCVALASGAAAFFRVIPSYRTQSLARNELEALLTLAMGSCFYLVAAAWVTRPDRLRFVLRWVNWGGLLIVAWALLQALVFWRFRSYPEWMHQIQGLTVTHELYLSRISGFAFEPSWLAHQLNMLYLPWWLAAAVRGETAHRWRLGFITLERALLAGGVAALVLSVSRIGLLGFLLMVALLLWLGLGWLVRWLEGKLLARGQAAGKPIGKLARYALRAGIMLGMLVLLAGLFLAAGYGLSKFDPRMANLFDLRALRNYNFTYYANQLVFAERIIFWEAGWKTFAQYPLLGVGPGVSGFYFMDNLSAFSWHLTEVRTLMYHLDVLPNIKSLWVRLLAETGLAGFACFAAFLIVHGFSANWLRRFGRGLTPVMGLAGLLALVGLVTEGFSVDTYGLPYYWITLGLIAGATAGEANGAAGILRKESDVRE